jgi:DNA-binding transcriptional LysR family regulator
MGCLGFPKNEKAMSGPSFAEISAFVSVLDRTSFAGAAKQLGLSPPRVSELVRSLEERLGVRLVERTTRSVAATEAGERLLARLRPVLDDYQAALDSIADFRDKPAGTVRLTVAPPAADFVLAPVLADFFAQYPEITLEVAVSGALTDIVAGRFDAGIRTGERLERDMIAVRVSDPIPFAVVASPSYLARRGVPKTPQDLMGHNCIRFRFPSGAIFSWHFQTRHEVFEAQITGTLIVGESLGLAVKAAVNGVGLLQMPPMSVAAELASGALVRVLDEWAPPPMQGFFLYYPGRRQIRPALKALIDFLRDSHRRTSTEAPLAHGFAFRDAPPVKLVGSR